MDWTFHVVQFIRENLKAISWVVTVALVFFVLLFAASRINAYRVGKAAGALYAAQKLAQGSQERQKALEEIADDYPSTSSGHEAMMLLGDMLMARGDSQAAKEQFARLADKSRGNELMKIAAMHREAAAERAMGNLQGAADTYIAAGRDPKNLNRADSLYQAARCLEDLKDYDGAAKLYKEVIESSPEGMMKLKSEERLLWLVANGSISG